MTDHPDCSYPSDICLLLRAHGEQRWLTSELLPLLRQLEPPRTIPEEDLGAALAYLEVLWIEASRRAVETEAAFTELLVYDANGDRFMHAEARQYNASVRAMREAIARQVRHLIAAPSGIGACEGARL
ncbi:MAG TPA: hypothetical protein VKG62_01360 [Solirubrobacteraceae bacterium]|nr:hypothetical protein [Solirubrobacteraceae bacterium]